MSERCQGCGALLQHDRPQEAGYTPKAGSALCQRCFRLTHYDDLQFSMREMGDPDPDSGADPRDGRADFVGG